MVPAAEVFNEMREQYDDLQDLWYAWLFSRLHYLIAREVLTDWGLGPGLVLDVGCGTGFQSFLYALTGADVVGIDISDQLIAAAKAKALKPPSEWWPLFPTHFDFVSEYDESTLNYLRKFQMNTVHPPLFDVMDARNLHAFADSIFDHVVCCGSTLSFIPDHYLALMEMARVLKPGGTFVLQVDATPFRKHYHLMTESSWASPILGRPVETVLKLFAKPELLRELESAGLIVAKSFWIHSLTGLMPHADSAKPGRIRQRIFRALRTLEEAMPSVPGHSLVLMGIKPHQVWRV